MNNFEEITKNPETLGAFLRGCPSLKRRGMKNSSGSIVPGAGKSVVTMVALARMRTSGTIRFGGYRRRAERRRRYEPKGTAPRRVKLTAKTARALAMQEFGTARGLTKSTAFVGAYFMEVGNLRIEICADAACIAVRVVLAHGTVPA